MSSVSAIPSQNTTHFDLTRKIWNEAWYSNEAFSMKSLCAKVACIVFPIILSVALVESIVWVVRSVFKIPSNPKTEPLNPIAVKQALVETNKNAEQENRVVYKPEQPEQKPAILGENTNTPKTNTEDQLNTNPIVAVTKVDASSVKNPNIITVVLKEGSSQHDIVGNHYDPKNLKPPACAYHALRAMYFFAFGFEGWSYPIEQQNSEKLSKEQQQMIKFGAHDYFAAVEKDSSLKGCADLEYIRVRDPDYLGKKHLFLDPTNRDPRPIAERTQAIVEHLFIPHAEPEFLAPRNILQISFITTNNGESIGVACASNQTIFFNSHKNAITMTVGKEATQEYLTEILQGDGAHPFSYALGQYDRLKEVQPV